MVIGYDMILVGSSRRYTVVITELDYSITFITILAVEYLVSFPLHLMSVEHPFTAGTTEYRTTERNTNSKYGGIHKGREATIRHVEYCDNAINCIQEASAIPTVRHIESLPIQIRNLLYDDVPATPMHYGDDR